MKGNVKILRFNPNIDERPYFEEYKYEYIEGITILDVLNYIYENIDKTLSYSYCCKNGHCGICAVSVNGKPVLSCKKLAKERMVIEPLKNIKVVKDLVIDRDDYERKLPKLRLFLERKCKAKSEPEKIDMDSFEKFKVVSRCIECLSCVSICPIYAKIPHLFLGPMGYILEARHLFDPRDDLNREVLFKSEGINFCTDCGLCSKVCYHKVSPSQIIRDIKNILVN